MNRTIKIILAAALVATIAGCSSTPTAPAQADKAEVAAGFVVINVNDQVAVPVFDSQSVILDARQVIHAVEMWLQSRPTAN